MSLPEFEAPPLVETVLSIQFDPLDRLQLPVLGLFWSLIQSEYPHSEIQPPLPQIVEVFSRGQIALEPPTLELGSEPPVRFWFINSDQSRVIQIQKNRFVLNWRGVAQSYPRYNENRQKLKDEWTRFCGFLDSRGIGTPRVNQCEITYLNHIPVESNGGASILANDVFPILSKEAGSRFLPLARAVTVQAVYSMPENQGRLHVSVSPALRRLTGEEIFVLELTARGAPMGSGVNEILGWLDSGHEWVVRGFTDFTSPRMHGIWKMKKEGETP